MTHSHNTHTHTHTLTHTHWEDVWQSEREDVWQSEYVCERERMSERMSVCQTSSLSDTHTHTHTHMHTHTHTHTPALLSDSFWCSSSSYQPPYPPKSWPFLFFSLPSRFSPPSNPRLRPPPALPRQSDRDCCFWWRNPRTESKETYNRDSQKNPIKETNTRDP